MNAQRFREKIIYSKEAITAKKVYIKVQVVPKAKQSRSQPLTLRGRENEQNKTRAK